MPASRVNVAAPNGYATTKEAMEILGVTRMTINRLWRQGLLKKYRAENGQNVYYRVRDLEALKRSRYSGPLTLVSPVEDKPVTQ